MIRTPNARLRVLVLATKCAIVSTLAFLAVAATGTVQTEGMTAGQDYTAAPHQGRIDALMARHDCSLTGFGADVVPGSALVLRDDQVQHVSFDAGWAVYTGEAAGILLAVCRPDV
ncbi:hypothetical protein BH11ACT8_BH11ACT8_27350 [soil metagenome]